MGNQLRPEKRAHDYMLARCRSERRLRLARKLEAAPVTLGGGVPAAYLRVRDEAMHTLGVGTMRGMKSVVSGILVPSIRSVDYTLAADGGADSECGRQPAERKRTADGADPPAVPHDC